MSITIMGSFFKWSNTLQLQGSCCNLCGRCSWTSPPRINKKITVTVSVMTMIILLLLLPLLLPLPLLLLLLLPLPLPLPLLLLLLLPLPLPLLPPTPLLPLPLLPRNAAPGSLVWPASLSSNLTWCVRRTIFMGQIC